MADVVLRIDADTQAYIAKLSKAAEASKQLTDQTTAHGGAMSKVGDAAASVFSKLTGMAVPLSGLGVATAGILAAFKGWNENLEKTKEALKDAAGLTNALLAAGKGAATAEFMSAANKANKFLKAPELAASVGAYLGPGGMTDASTKDITRAVSAANLAHAGGVNAEAYSDVLGKLDAAGVSGSQDLAFYLLQRAGGDEKAIELIQQHPDKAAQFARLFAAGRGQGRPGTGMLRQFSEAYTQFGGDQDPTAFFQNSGALFGAQQNRAVYDALKSRLARTPGPEAGQLLGAAKIGGGLKASGLEVEAYNVLAEHTRQELYGDAAKKSNIREARFDALNAQYRFGGLERNVLHPIDFVGNQFGRFSNPSDDVSAAKSDVAGKLDRLVNAAEDQADLTRQQNGILSKKSLSSDSRQDEAR